MELNFGNVIIIEDDPVDTFIAQQLLKGRCKNINAYKNGKVAMDSLRDMKELPELILLDINMPEMNGFEFLSKFNKLFTERNHDVTIYMLTSSDDEKDKKNALKYPFVKKFITKPLSHTSLLDYK